MVRTSRPSLFAVVAKILSKSHAECKDMEISREFTIVSDLSSLLSAVKTGNYALNPKRRISAGFSPYGWPHAVFLPGFLDLPANLLPAAAAAAGNFLKGLP